MARARIIVLSSPRLARLDGLLVASGANPGRVERLDDAMELFEVQAATGALLVADLKDVPFADAGLLRRWQEGSPGSRILWVGGDGAIEGAFHDAGIRGSRLRWPLDMEALEELAKGEVPRAAQAEPGAPRSLGDEPSAVEPQEPGPRHAPSSGADAAPDAGGHSEPDGGRDRELSEIESILGQGHAPQPSGAQEHASASIGTAEPVRLEGSVAADPMTDREAAGPLSPSPQPRSAFLRTPTAQAERPIPVPESTLRGTTRAPEEQVLDGVDPEEDPVAIESPANDPHSLDGPLLTDEEIEAFFGESDDFVIPAMEPAGRETLPSDGAPTSDASGALPMEPDVEPTLDDGPADAPPDAAETDAAARDSRRPAWLKDQVADLADIVQALDLTARSTHAHLGLERELGQLRPCTRTIGYVAAPPPRGEQAFDLAVLLEEQLGALAGQSPDSPRILFRSRIEGAQIEADKLLVTMALEALLLTAVGCAGAGDVVRVSIDAGDAGAPCIHIRFPAGPMADLSPADAMQPYALKARLPDIGANALAAAGAIAVGQGGDLVLRDEEGGHRVFDVSFSGAPRA